MRNTTENIGYSPHPQDVLHCSKGCGKTFESKDFQVAFKHGESCDGKPKIPSVFESLDNISDFSRRQAEELLQQINEGKIIFSFANEDTFAHELAYTTVSAELIKRQERAYAKERMVEWLEKNHVFTYLEGDALYHYDEKLGFYAEDAEAVIKTAIERLMRKMDEIYCKKPIKILVEKKEQSLEITMHYDFPKVITLSFANEIIGHIKRNLKPVKRNDFAEPLNLINVANGVLDINTLELKPHGPEYKFLGKIPAAYKPGATSVKIRRFMEQVVSSEDVLVLEEIAGYVLLRSYPIQKAVMFLGGGANGKGVWVNLLIAFVGLDSVAHVPLQELAKNRFAAANLYNKNLNAYADLPVEALADTGLFKVLVGGDRCYAEQKFKTPFGFYNQAKLVFSANRLPGTKDYSDGFFRRWLIVRFPNQFTGTDENPDLIKELSTPEELSGLLNLAVAGLKRLLAQKNFSNQKSIDELREIYLKESDSVFAFSQSELETSIEGWVEKDALYNTYVVFCKGQKILSLNKPYFFQHLHKQLALEDYRPKAKDGEKSRPYALRGIKLKNVQEGEECLSKAQTAQTQISMT